jgi:hypothetical protein
MSEPNPRLLMSAPLVATFDCFYFGCPLGDIGHYWFTPGSVHRQWLARDVQPWGTSVDGGLQPGGALVDVQGKCRIHFKAGWTAIAWWDRSEDRRGKSCSVFALCGDHNFEHMVAAFRASFPWAADRMKFELVLTGGAA